MIHFIRLFYIFVKHYITQDYQKQNENQDYPIFVNNFLLLYGNNLLHFYSFTTTFKTVRLVLRCCTRQLISFVQQSIATC